MNKILLSVVIIAKNAEKQIGKAINSSKFADEIIIVDNGSTDKTIQISKDLGAKVVECESSSFSELRNYGLSKTLGDWIFYLDSDEVISEELKKNILGNISVEKDGEVGAYKIKRKNYYFGNNAWPKIEKLERLLRKSLTEKWHGDLHETPIVKGKIEEIDGYLLHYAHQDLTSMLEKTIEWSKIEADLRLKANHPKITWWRFPRVMLSAFFDSYIKQGGWKVGTVGLIEGIYQSFSMFITYARLWEMQNEKTTKK